MPSAPPSMRTRAGRPVDGADEGEKAAGIPVGAGKGLEAGAFTTKAAAGGFAQRVGVRGNGVGGDKVRGSGRWENRGGGNRVRGRRRWENRGGGNRVGGWGERGGWGISRGGGGRGRKERRKQGLGGSGGKVESRGERGHRVGGNQIFISITWLVVLTAPIQVQDLRAGDEIDLAHISPSAFPDSSSLVSRLFIARPIGHLEAMWPGLRQRKHLPARRN